VNAHQESGADVTIAALPCTAEQASEFGILRLDDSLTITGFVEKPKTAAAREPVRMSAAWMDQRGVKANGREYLASMGIYLFKRKALLDLLRDMPEATDFGKHIFPASIKTHKVKAHLFDGYWEDLGTVKAYHEANLALAGDNPPFDFHSPDGVIYTRMRFLPASRVGAAKMKHVLISDGCVIEEGADLNNCVIGVRSRVGKNVVLRDTVLLGADRFETDTERAANTRRGRPSFTIGDGSVIEGAIVDKDCRIGRNVRIRNAEGKEDTEGQGYVIRDGVVVIPKGTELPDGTVI
jgi:glucose-1-phosphate adenylyltransferase